MALKFRACALALLILTGCSGSRRRSDTNDDKNFRVQMREFGIRRAEVEVHFTWVLGPTSPEPVREIYLSNYGLDSPQITDPQILEEIKKSGLEDKLKVEGLAHVKGGAWLDLPETPPFPAAASVSVFDDASRVSNSGIYWRDDPNRTPWQQALFSNDLADILRMMASGQIGRKELDEGLFWGCASKRDQLLQILLKAGANVNSVQVHDKERITPLMVAVRWRNKEAVETLVKAGAKAGARDEYGETELTTLLNDSSDQTPIVEPLLQSGVDVNAANNYGLTALIRASRAQPATVLELLIKHGADVNAKSYRGDTALSVATENGNDAGAKVLLEAGAQR
jgi:ankyrin repeat protein